MSLIPADVRGQANRFDFHQGVAALESTVERAKAGGHGSIRSPFPVEAYARMEIWEDHQTMSMWLEAPISSVVGVLDQVRSRALEFVLEIEAENPKAGDNAEGEPPVSMARADVIFNAIILGGQVALGPNASVEVSVLPGDLGSLLRYLEAQGVDRPDRNELAEAIRSDAAEGGREGPGKRVTAWLGRMTLKFATSGGRVGEGTAAALIAAAVARYVGLL